MTLWAIVFTLMIGAAAFFAFGYLTGARFNEAIDTLKMSLLNHIEQQAEKHAGDLAELESRMVTRILAGESLIRVQTEPTSPLFNPDRGLVPALSFGPVDFILYRAADYDEPLRCCQHGGPLVEGEEFYLISLNNAPEPGAVLAVCLPCHQEEKRRVLGS